MSLCNPCSPVQPIPYCSEVVVIGTGAANTDYAVQFLNTATGRTDTELVTSDAYGAIEVEWLNRQEHATYTISIFGGVTFEVDGITDPVTCISAHFVRDGQDLASYTLTAQE